MKLQDWLRLPFRLLFIFVISFFLAQDFRLLSPTVPRVRIFGTPYHPIIVPLEELNGHSE